MKKRELFNFYNSYSGNNPIPHPNKKQKKQQQKNEKKERKKKQIKKRQKNVLFLIYNFLIFAYNVPIETTDANMSGI